MKRVFCLSITFIFLFFHSDIYAQQEPDNLITANFTNVTFGAFVKKVEAQTSFHFYYTASQFDSLSITISVKAAHLPSILDKIFANTDWKYTIDKNNNIFITKGFSIAAELPFGFFDGKADTTQVTTKSRTAESSFISNSKKVNHEILIESKLFEIGIKRNEAPNGKVNIAGYVRDAQNGEAISGALIYIEHPHIQVTSDQFGYYSMILPAGHHTLNIIAPGMFDTKRQLMLYSNGKFDVEMLSL